jgi:hypothetical protein
MLYDITALFNQTAFSNQTKLDALDVISARPPTRSEGSPPNTR